MYPSEVHLFENLEVTSNPVGSSTVFFFFRGLYLFKLSTSFCIRKLSEVLIATFHLVDPASSHMLVSMIKPCMSKFPPLNGKTANDSLQQLWFT